MSALRVLFASVLLVIGGLPAIATELPAHFANLEQSEIRIVTASGTHYFRVWIAADSLSRQQGLMHVRELPLNRGMLFEFDAPHFAWFWMKNTFISLDLAFIGADGRVVNIARDAKPQSLDPLWSAAPVGSVLEVAAGTAARIGLKPGDKVSRTPASAPKPP